MRYIRSVAALNIVNIIIPVAPVSQRLLTEVTGPAQDVHRPVLRGFESPEDISSKGTFTEPLMPFNSNSSRLRMSRSSTFPVSSEGNSDAFILFITWSFQEVKWL